LLLLVETRALPLYVCTLLASNSEVTGLERVRDLPREIGAFRRYVFQLCENEKDSKVISPQ
jgi:hypothetical protein